LVCCLQSVFVDCLIEQTHQDIQAKEGTDVSYDKQLNNVSWNSLLRLLKYIITGSWCTGNYATSSFCLKLDKVNKSNKLGLQQHNNKQSLDEVFCDIQKNEDRGKCYQLRRRLKLITLTVTLKIWDITKTESSNWLIIHCFEENNDKHTFARNLNWCCY